MPVISTQSLSRSFGSVQAVDALDLDVPEGCVFGFLGPNGAGKTTTIRMLLGLISADRGSITVFGENLATSRRQIAKRVGALVESPSCYAHLTGRENLEVTRRLIDAPRERIDTVLAMFGLHDAANRLAGSYSMGMKQRLGLATAMLADPRLLILDEPTNGLDPAGIQEIRQQIQSLPERTGVTVFLSSHLLAEVERVASHVGIINRGRLLFQGTMAELDRQRTPSVEIGTDRPDEAARILQSEGFAVTHDEATDLLLLTPQEPGTPQRVAQLLVARGFALHHLVERKPSLEEIFLGLTSRGEG